MEDDPIEAIRENSRILLHSNRQQQRVEMSDVNRAMGRLRITPKIVSDISNKLKTKASISLFELRTLKIGLAEDDRHRVIFLNSHGSTRGLIRELTGRNTRKQRAAAECLCNLALGDTKMCKYLAKVAGPYLVTALDHHNRELAIASIWTIANLAGSKSQMCDQLITQGVIPKLCNLMQGDGCVENAAFHALVHFAYQMRDDLRQGHLARLLGEITKAKLEHSACHLLFVLSCHRDFPAHVTDELTTRAMGELPRAIDAHIEACSYDGTTSTCCRLIYLVRALANVEPRRAYPLLDLVFAARLRGKVMRLLGSHHMSLCIALLWLLGNLYNHDANHAFFHAICHSKRG